VSAFSPIAIIGRACLLPGAQSPESLWAAIQRGEELLSEVPPGRWRVHPELLRGEGPDQLGSTRGGYIQDFQFDPQGYALPAHRLVGLDPLFQWSLYCARAALEDAGIKGEQPRAGLILGNLSFPSQEMSRLAEAHWLGLKGPRAENRFMSGLPALLTQKALALGLPSFALDTACASALYALKLACDRLHEGEADLMLAGAVNRADDLFIHMGFSALKALSPSGQSRPFHSEADGLLPAEGAGFLLLKRLADARRDGDQIHGVIRGIGLSNDGRGRGLLKPSVEGQRRAIEQALEVSGFSAEEISYLECHATGTHLGDSTELFSAAQIYQRSGLPIGSLKGNLGHLITASGLAGIIKLMEALKAKEFPRSRHLEGGVLQGSPYRLISTPEPWEGPLRAALSAFGFGGNNAHLILEAENPEIPDGAPPSPSAREPIALINLGMSWGSAEGVEEVLAALKAGAPGSYQTKEISLAIKGLRFPPQDLRETLPQQLMMLRCALEAIEEPLPEETGVFVGMGADPAVCRYGLRWRGEGGDPEEIIPVLSSAGVLGCMPNILANRLNSQFDLKGASFTISAEERSGLVALELAAEALRRGELEAALVGAVDLASDPVHTAAAQSLGLPQGADVALCLVLKRLRDVGQAPILALLSSNQQASSVDLPPLEAQTASGLFQLIAGLAQARPSQEISLSCRDMEGIESYAALLRGPAPLRGAALKRELRFPAHRAPLKEQPMLPAPSLPPLSGEPAQERPQPRSLEPALWREPLLLLTQVHQEQLEQQAALQKQFLQFQERSLALLIERGPLGGTQQSLAQERGVLFERADLEIHASGRISQLFGPLFEQQDAFHCQVRMPEPPLLLADRVIALEGEAGSMGLGRVQTETDVRGDAWYSHQGRMPAGVMIESGQADLLLISYLGIDFLNQGKRAYRLLACELSYHGGLPKAGETLEYDIRVDAHARQGDLRLFFFHYDCQVQGQLRLKVRGGQAGFFTEQELAESAGVLWSPEEGERSSQPRLDPPLISEIPAQLSSAQVQAFAEGRPWDCFGSRFDYTRTHSRSPQIQGGQMLLLGRVTCLEHQGGPWGRGYLQAESPIQADDWYFQGHFKNDPCMPGTLMFEGCLQAMALYMASLGHTIQRDGWRFEPVPEERYPLICRGQATPSSRLIRYEVFVDEVIAEPIPTLYADILCTVDGLKAFHARRMGLQLIPGWPLEDLHIGAQRHSEAVVRGGICFDGRGLLASALGPPSQAFGPMYRRFDGPRRVARLPGPPYHFMSRVTQIQGEIGVMEPGAEIELIYEIPPEAWYFQENGHPVMPFAILLEAALQPCGWLASYVGSALKERQDLSFRNLDGEGRVLAELKPNSGALHSRIKLLEISRSAGMIIERFEVECSLGNTPVYQLQTLFGFFPKAALEAQVGLPSSSVEEALFNAASSFSLDLRRRPAPYCEGSLSLAGPMLLMLDEISGYWPEGGARGLGQARGEKWVDPGEWFFKAHFFQDPVQPGSLGLEALLQLLQFVMIEKGAGGGMRAPRFESIALKQPMIWRYRGQVVPSNRRISTTLELKEYLHDERGVLACADGSLWVDGTRIYEARGLTIRVCEAL